MFFLFIASSIFLSQSTLANTLADCSSTSSCFELRKKLIDSIKSVDIKIEKLVAKKFSGPEMQNGKKIRLGYQAAKKHCLRKGKHLASAWEVAHLMQFFGRHNIRYSNYERTNVEDSTIKAETKGRSLEDFYPILYLDRRGKVSVEFYFSDKRLNYSEIERYISWSNSYWVDSKNKNGGHILNGGPDISFNNYPHQNYKNSFFCLDSP